MLQILLDEKLISQAQADLAKSDSEISGMTIGEVLLARRWVNDQTLDRVAPWLKDSDPAPSVVAGSNGDDADGDYQQNYKRYRQLMQKILDEN
ncbi:MAG TPA: hypothetical protein V6C76_09450 [Drouetiella sp.]